MLGSVGKKIEFGKDKRVGVTRSDLRDLLDSGKVVVGDTTIYMKD